MKLRERALSILKGKVADRLPWYGYLNDWHNATQNKGLLEKKYMGFEGILNLHRDLRVGCLLGGEPYIPVYRNCEVVEVERKSTSYEKIFNKDLYRGSKIIKSKDNNDIIREVSTPVGKIKEIWKYSPITFSWAPTKYFINSIQDLKVFKYWIQNTNYKPFYDVLDMIKEGIGEQGLVLSSQPRSPFSQFITLYAGIINTINLFMDDRKLFNETIKVLEQKSDEEAEITLKSPTDVIGICENLSSDVVGKNFFEDYIRPFDEKWTKKIKGEGKYSLMHFDGYLKGLLKEASKLGFSIINGMTPKPSGDLEISEFRDYVKSNTIMWGGIPAIFFTSFVNDKEFEKFVSEAIKVFVSEPRYILGMGDEIPANGLIKRVKMVSDLVEKYGLYKK